MTVEPAGLPLLLKALRQDRGLSQAALAEALGYDVTYVAKLEAGTRPPTRQLLARLAHLDGPDLRGSLGMAPAGDVARPPLPYPPMRFVGREAELRAVLALLDSGCRVVSLAGPPGIGKSRLALEVAIHCDRILPNGSWWVPLADVADASQLAYRIARELGLPAPAEADAFDRLLSRLRDQRVLVVLDNFEHVLAARSLVEAMVDEVDGLRVLVTTREPLGIAGEHVLPLNGLPLPVRRGVSMRSLATARTSPAVELFVSRARMLDPRFSLTEANAGAVAQACARLDGVPLAIILAASRVSTEGVEAVAKLAAAPLGLGQGPVDMPPHHRNLHAAVDVSWQRLSQGERVVLAALSVFQCGFGAEAATVVCGPDAAAGDLDRLVRKSLVESSVGGDSAPRFELLETIRAFAAAQLTMGGGDGDAHRRHAHYYSDLACELGAGLTTHAQQRCIVTIARDHDNLAVAFEWCVTRDPERAVAVAAATWRYFLVRDIPTGRSWLSRALDAGGDLSPDRAAALAGAGALAWVTGHGEASAAFLDEADLLAGKLGLPDVEAVVALNRGALAEQLNRFDEADSWFAAAIEKYEGIGDRRGRASVLVGQGMLAFGRGQPETARRRWVEAAELFAEVGDRFNRAVAVSNLARSAQLEGDLDRARGWWTECRRIQVALGDARGLADTLDGLGRLALIDGHPDRAERLLLDALAGFQRLDDRPGAASTLAALAESQGHRGRWPVALWLAGCAQALGSQMGASPRGADLRHIETVMAGASQHLDVAGVRGALAYGRTLSLRDVVEVVAVVGA